MSQMKQQQLKQNQNHFKGLDQKELEALLYFIKQWYCKNDDTGLFDKTKRGRLITSILGNFDYKEHKLPEYLYRSYSFETKKELNDFRSKIIPGKTLLSHPHKDYESWTSDRKIAEKYLPGGESMIDEAKQREHGIMLKISKDDYIDSIFFSMDFVFNNQIEKKKFLPFIFKYLSKDILNNIKENKSVQNQIKDMQYLIPGIVRAITESEYILSELVDSSPEVVKQITTKG